MTSLETSWGGEGRSLVPSVLFEDAVSILANFFGDGKFDFPFPLEANQSHQRLNMFKCV